MERTQIYLTEKERKALRSLAKRLGRSQSSIIREAVDSYIARYRESSRRELLRRAHGIWADRQDLPDLKEVRKEFDRVDTGDR